jgi:hypothetical protein
MQASEAQINRKSDKVGKRIDKRKNEIREENRLKQTKRL